MALRNTLSLARSAVTQQMRHRTVRTFAAQPATARQAPVIAMAGATAIGVTGLYLASPAANGSSYDLSAVRAEIERTIDDEEARRDDGTSIGPTYVRLAWHSAGTFSKADGSGGSNGCRMRFGPEAGWGANAGLSTARASLEAVHTKFPAMSYADLYTFAGKVAVEKMGGPTIPWSAGRTDVPDGSTSPPDGRLPDADKGSDTATAQHLRDIFYRMGFNDKEIVALSGAHALGRCHEDASGFWGPWTFAETTMSNEYFRLLVEEPWTPKKTHQPDPVNGSKTCPWKGPTQYEDKTGKLMMLPSDIVLTKDESFAKHVAVYAKNEEAFFNDFASAFGKLLALGVPAGGAAAADGGGLLGKIKGMLGM